MSQKIIHSLRRNLFSGDLWSDLKESIRGTEKDFTQIPISKAILLLSIPMVLEMIMESVFALVDIWFVSRLGSSEVAVVGITESMMTLIYAIGMGLGVGTTALVSRRIGEHNPRAAAQAAVQAIIATVAVSILFSVIGIIFAKDMLRFMGATEETIEMGYHYPMIMLGGNAVIMLLFVINAVFRSSGDAAISMRILLIANLLNIILDPLLIFGWGPIPAMGLKGAAIATNTGRGIAVIYQLYILMKGQYRIKVKIEDLKLQVLTIVKVIRLSLGAIGQNLISHSSWVFLVWVITSLGENAIAGYTIAIRVIIFVLLPSWGMSNAAATLVGQNLGAQQPDRAERSAWIVGGVNMVLLGIVSIVFISVPQLFINFFVDKAIDPEVWEAGITCLRVVSFGFLIYALGMVMVQSINGAGDTTTPILLNVIAFWIIEIPLAYILTNMADMGVIGVCYAIVVAETMLALMAMFIFKRGKWKLKQV
ncbi:MAG: MATE family efflux transporter [Bacteroidales bacterium]